MIKFSLQCSNGHGFEAWFPGNDSFADQKARGFVTCPHCNDASVEKTIMAPNVQGGKGRGSKDDLRRLRRTYPRAMLQQPQCQRHLSRQSSHQSRRLNRLNHGGQSTWPPPGSSCMPFAPRCRRHTKTWAINSPMKRAPSTQEKSPTVASTARLLRSRLTRCSMTGSRLCLCPTQN